MRRGGLAREAKAKQREQEPPRFHLQQNPTGYNIESNCEAGSGGNQRWDVGRAIGGVFMFPAPARSRRFRLFHSMVWTRTFALQLRRLATRPWPRPRAGKLRDASEWCSKLTRFICRPRSPLNGPFVWTPNNSHGDIIWLSPRKMLPSRNKLWQRFRTHCVSARTIRPLS